MGFQLPSRLKKLFFSRKMTKSFHPFHPQISFNIIPVSRASFQKHLGIYLDEKLWPQEKMAKAVKRIGVIK